jgi:CheY-like chemotaxis protein
METSYSEKPVLVIEDEESIREIIKYTLEQNGHTVKVAENGKKGLEMAKEEPLPKVILLDWMMPEMDGVEVLNAIREDYETEKIPVIMLTAKSAIGNIEDAFEARADGYITKPFDPDLLWPMIKEKLKECIPNRRKYWNKKEEKVRPTTRKRNPENLVG